MSVGQWAAGPQWANIGLTDGAMSDRWSRFQQKQAEADRAFWSDPWPCQGVVLRASTR